MSETKIEWATYSFNPWWGCERVSPACAHCYAATFAKRVGQRDLWTKGGEHSFRFFGDKHWNEPLKWAAKAAREGTRPRVFCASMADVFEEIDALDQHRDRLFDLIEATPDLDWLILTKRPEFASEYLRSWYAMRYAETDLDGSDTRIPLPNVWLGVSIENARFTWRADVLREIPAAVRFISAEPLLGPIVDVGPRSLDLTGIDWIIVGGESGPGARPFHLEHAREIIAAAKRQECCGKLRQECCGHYLRTGECCGDGVPICCGEPDIVGPAVFVKQLGARPHFIEGNRVPMVQLRDRKGGDPDEWPADLRIREFPQSAVRA